MTGKPRGNDILGTLENWLNTVEEKTHPFYEYWKSITTLRPVWKYMGDDLGRIMGWEHLIDKTEHWMRFVDTENHNTPSTSKAQSSSALLQGKFNAFGSLNIASRNKNEENSLTDRMAAIFWNRPAALAMQAKTLSVLLLNLHGEEHHHHHADPAQHQLEHFRDRENLALLNKALLKAMPEFAPRTDELAAFSFRQGLTREEKRAFVIREKLLQHIGKDAARQGRGQEKLDQACLASAPSAAIRPAQHPWQAIKWDVVMALSLFASPVVMGTAKSGINHFYPSVANQRGTPQELVTGAGQYYENPLLRNVGLYAGCMTLATFSSLLRKKRALTTGEKVLKVAAFGGHNATELSHFIGVFQGLAEQFPHFRTFLDGIGQTVLRLPFIGGEFIAENLSDVALAEGSAELSCRIMAKTPLPDGKVKDTLELFLANTLAIMGTLSLDQALASVTPYLSAGLAAVFGGYGIIKAGHRIKTAWEQRQEKGVSSSATPSRHSTLLARFGTVAASVMAVASVFGSSVQQIAEAPVAPSRQRPIVPTQIQTQTAATRTARGGAAVPQKTVARTTPMTLASLNIQKGSWFIQTLEKNDFTSDAATRISEAFRTTGMNIDRVYPHENITVLNWNDLKGVSFRGQMKLFDAEGQEVRQAAQVLALETVATLQQAMGMGR